LARSVDRQQQDLAGGCAPARVGRVAHRAGFQLSPASGSNKRELRSPPVKNPQEGASGGQARHDCLVVFVPGIGGSVLESPDKIVVWSSSLGQIARVVAHPDRLANQRLRAIGLVKRQTFIPGLAVIHGYQEGMEALGRAFESTIDWGHPDQEDLDARVVAFPYDFRLGIGEIADRLDAFINRRLTHRRWTGQRNRVVIVSHSMGGLVARQWVSQGNWPVCRAVVTLGTPHRGAPKALEYLVNGPSPWIPNRGELRELMRSWTSMYELIPRYRSVWDYRTRSAVYPKDLLIGSSFPGYSRHSRLAFELHTNIETSWKSNGWNSHTLAIIGRGHGTILGASWNGTALRSTKRPPSWLKKEMTQDERGDGTVPELSALPIEQGALLQRHRYPLRHGEMASGPVLLAHLERIFGDLSPATDDARGNELRLGLDLEEAYLQGEPFDVGARMIPLSQVPPAMDLSYVVEHNGNQVRKGSLDHDAGRWSAAVVGLPDGLYRLAVTARAPGLIPISSADWFVVLDEHGCRDPRVWDEHEGARRET
jgi:pimeloyl-ACP methyl ester carboxylesterase